MARRSLTHEARRFVTSDRTELAYTLWRGQSQGRIRRIVAILPGIGFHSGPYRIVSESMDLPNTMFAGLDYRGHGHSDGRRGKIPSPKRMSLDIQEWLAELSAIEPESETYLLGESMGGPYAILTSLVLSCRLDGLILIAPAVLPNWRLFWNVDSLRVLVRTAWNPFKPVIDLSTWRLDLSSRDSDFVRTKRTDALSLQIVSPTYVLRIAQAIVQSFLRKTIRIECPVFIAQGTSDHVLSPLGSRLLAMRITCSDKTYRSLPNAFHTLFWDPVRPQLFGQLSEWIRSRGVVQDQ